jgi:hypothetical protein
VKRAAVFFLLPFFFAVPGRFAAAADLPAWLNAVRAAEGLEAVSMDDSAMKAAEAYAAVLAGLGRISHAGLDGSDALTRYLRAGGTSAHVGEIIGAGPGLAEIEAAWLKSGSHRSSILKPYWTHAGWGSAKSGNATVFVVVFVRTRVRGLTVGTEADGMRVVSGRFIDTEAAGAILLCGISAVDPVLWNTADRSFRFRVSAEADFSYVRLGYLTAENAFVITDVITSPRGRESPPGQTRF